jgi:L-amino acid N-acyltransferase
VNTPREPRAEVTLREAGAGDLVAINDIFNYYVSTSTCTYQEEPETIDDRAAWFTAHGPNHPVIVAEAGSEIIAWGALSPYGGVRARRAYRFTVEDSVYVRHDLHGHGIGTAILADLVRRATTLGYRSILASVSADRTPSIRLHEKFGFIQVARFREVGLKFDTWLDVVYLQKRL